MPDKPTSILAGLSPGDVVELTVERQPVYENSGAGAGKVSTKRLVFVKLCDDGDVLLRDTRRGRFGWKRVYRLTPECVLSSFDPTPLRYFVVVRPEVATVTKQPIPEAT